MRLILALILMGTAATSFAADPPKPNYYPLAKGTKWEYRVSAEDKQFAVTCEIMESEIKEGKTHGRMEAKLPNSVTLGEELYTDLNGVYRTAILGAKLLQPLPILKYPIKPRDAWNDKIKVGESEGAVAITIKDTMAVIDVPAGKFTTLAVESIVNINGDKVVACIWYADGIGIVKQETTCGHKIMTMELKKFSLPTK